MVADVHLLTLLGWSLLNSIWQMAACWIGYFILTDGNKRFTAAERHDLALAGVFMGICWFAYTFIHTFQVQYIQAGITSDYTSPYIISGLSLAYLIILITRFLTGGMQWVKMLNRKNKFTRIPSPDLQIFLDHKSVFMGIPRSVKIYLTEGSETAETSGFLKPLILLPFSLVTRLSTEQLEAILVHELLHIRRNDYLVNLVMSFFRSVFFFNPFAFLFFKTIIRERELACDDGVLKMNYQPAIYAEALFSLEKCRQVKPGFSLAADGKEPWLLMERISRVLGVQVKKNKQTNPLLFLSLIAAFLLLSLTQKRTTEHPQIAGKEKKAITAFIRKSIPDSKPTGMAQVKSVHTQIIPAVKNKRSVKEIIIEPFESVPVAAITNDDLPKAYFADQREALNFTNDQAAKAEPHIANQYMGVPFVPSESFSYDPLLLNPQYDSMLQMNLKNIVAFSAKQTEAMQGQIKSEIDRTLKQLKIIQHKRLILIRMKESRIQPKLEKMLLQIQNKKLEIDQLQIQLHLSDEEIIHI